METRSSYEVRRFNGSLVSSHQDSAEAARALTERDMLVVKDGAVLRWAPGTTKPDQKLAAKLLAKAGLLKVEPDTPGDARSTSERALPETAPARPRFAFGMGGAVHPRARAKAAARSVPVSAPTASVEKLEPIDSGAPTAAPVTKGEAMPSPNATCAAPGCTEPRQAARPETDPEMAALCFRHRKAAMVRRAKLRAADFAASSDPTCTEADCTKPQAKPTSVTRPECRTLCREHRRRMNWRLTSRERDARERSESAPQKRVDNARSRAVDAAQTTPDVGLQHALTCVAIVHRLGGVENARRLADVLEAIGER